MLLDLLCVVATARKFLSRAVVIFVKKLIIGKTINLVSISNLFVMCLSPIMIINPSKYISLKYRDRYLMSVPCGKCAECQQNNSLQWFQRAWQECTDVIRYGNFVYFATLTYNDINLPHMSDIVKELPYVSCFRPKDVRNFIEAFRLNLKRKYNTTFKYFLASEYGHDNLYKSDSGKIRRGTLRPHYHILFYVFGKIDPLDFSREVSEYWPYGHTDSIPYKSDKYVLKNCVISSSATPGEFLRACRYVTKYVQKSCLFDEKMNNRLNAAMLKIAEKMPDDWLNSVNAVRVRRKLKSSICQFHRQSKGFGASLLGELDIDSLFKTGVIYMPSPKGVVVPVLLSTYYKRKLFYDLVEIDGSKTWQLNELGQQFKEARKSDLLQSLSDLFYCTSLHYHLSLTKQRCCELADYVYNYQGRIDAPNESANLMEKLPSVTLFNYVTQSDKEHLSHCGIVDRFIGNNSIGYSCDSLPPSYRISQFIAKYVIIDQEKEKELHKIYNVLSSSNAKIQDAYSLKQRLENTYAAFRSLFEANAPA